MLAKRIIPVLLCRGETLVKGKQFNSWRSVGHVQQAARIHAMRGVDEMVILDIGATPEGRSPNLELVRKLTEGNFAPITVGGGVRTIKDVQDLLNAGADKVAICTVAIESHEIITQSVKHFGSQAIIISLDYRSGNNIWFCSGTKLYSRKEQDYIWNIRDFARYYADQGVGEIILTNINREGMMNGYDLDLIKAVSEAVEIPVIAHGGCGSYEHMHEALLAGADAVAAGSLFQFTDSTPKGAAEYLAKKGWEVRL